MARAGKVARDLAEALGGPTISFSVRELNSPRSALGQEQARTLGQWFTTQAPEGRPIEALCSPSVRARCS